MKKFEYHIEDFEPYEIGEKERLQLFNDLGKEGWELVSTMWQNRPGDHMHYHFKREIE